VLFIGATDKGEIEANPSNLDKLQKTFSEKLQHAYPPVYYTTKSVQENGRECLAVIVPGSVSRPHFAGPPYLRDGSQSIVPSPQQYDSLVAARVGKAYELQRWEGKLITLLTLSRQNGMAYVVNKNSQQATVVGANQFYLTVSFGNRTHSYSLSRIEISYDHVAGRLEVQVEGLPEPF
jgi:predicted HTH transcriptional regulator